MANIVTQKIKGQLIEGVFAWLNSQSKYLQNAQYSVIYRSDKHNNHCIMLGKYFCSMEVFCYALYMIARQKRTSS